MKDVIIKIEHIKKYYGPNRGVEDVSMEIMYEGEMQWVVYSYWIRPVR